MQTRVFKTASEFLAAATPFLLEHEAAHNLLLGLAGELEHNPYLFSQEEPFLALVQDGERVLGAALRTPPYRLSLGLLEETSREEALECLADTVFQRYPDLSGVSGPAESSDYFVKIWQHRTGHTAQRTMAQRIYQLTQVYPPSDIHWQLRLASQADRALLMAWFRGFHQDAMGSVPDEQQLGRSVTRWLETSGRSMFIWDVQGQPVCMTGVAGETPHGIRISAVYTPAKLRRQGYASACVAAVSQHMLDQGRKFCFLYTDLTNPISNSIYQRIGYRPVCDVNEYEFVG